MVRRLSSAAVLAVALAAPPTWACINGMKKENPAYVPSSRGVAKSVPDKGPSDGKRLNAQEQLTDANHKFLAGDWKGAQVSASRVIDQSEAGSLDQVRAQRIAGQSALKLKDYPAAVKYLRPLAEGPRATAYYKARLGEALVGSGESSQAKGILEGLAKSDLMPDAEGWVALAHARRTAGDHEGARAAVASALGRDPQNAEALALQQALGPAPAKASPAPARVVKTSDKS
jgi:predicted Zn-dependent protease